MNNYYIFTLPDCFVPAFITSYKYYFGAAEKRKNIKEQDMKPPIEAKLLCKRTFTSAEETHYSFLNTYGCEYLIKFSGYTVDVMVIEYGNKYGIFTQAEIENPGYYSEFSGAYTPLNGGFWGLSGQLQVNEKEDNAFTVSTSLAYMGEQFDESDEAVNYLINITEPDFQGFFEDVFGDG